MDHLSPEELRQRLDDAAQRVTVGATYAHYKHPDRPYRIVAIALMEATEQPAVIYEALDAPGIPWIRPLEDFTASVEHEGRSMPRFTKLP